MMEADRAQACEGTLPSHPRDASGVFRRGVQGRLQSCGVTFAALTLVIAVVTLCAPEQRMAIPVCIATGMGQLISILSFNAASKRSKT